jgi:hypothetical protein
MCPLKQGQTKKIVLEESKHGFCLKSFVLFQHPSHPILILIEHYLSLKISEISHSHTFADRKDL